MNLLATELNNTIQTKAPAIYKMLSRLGLEMFMPKGILSQGAEAKKKATKFNATLGIATTAQGPMFLDCVYENLTAFMPQEIFTYAPPAGVDELRMLWQKRIYDASPCLTGKSISLPVTTNALTHGLSIVADLFCNEGDYVVLPDKFWGNYRMTFSVRRGGILSTFTAFNQEGGFNVDGLLDKVRECSKLKPKVIVLLNFPNNPTGYTPTKTEAEKLATGLRQIAENGVQLVCVVDDAYYGMIYENDCMAESIFGLLTEAGDNLLAVKLDGATKELFVWGFRVGFITFGATNSSGQEDMLNALVEKVKGNIRGDISNSSHLSQTAILKALKHPEIKAQVAKNVAILKGRALLSKKLLNSGKYSDRFIMYPFNSGYFLCLKVLGVDTEKLRVYLLDNYGVGTISTSSTDLRIAFSCVEEDNIEELFDIIYKAVGELK